MRALLSVYDKEGLVELAQGLSDLGWELVASGNTVGRADARPGIAHTEVAEVTGSPEMLGRAGQDPPPQDPRRHPGRPLQARAPGRPGGQRDRRHRPRGVEPVPVLVGPLHRADRRRRARPWCAPPPRTTSTSASSPRRPTTPSCSRSCAPRARCRAATRRRLARAAFAHTAAYDAAIVAWLDAGGPAPVGGLEGATATDAEEAALSAVLPPTLHLTLERTEVLRYGENPHQRGSRYRTAGTTSWWDGMVQHGGNPLSLPQPLRRRRRLAAGPRAGGRRRRSRPWPSSSTPTPAAPPSQATSSPPTSVRSSATSRAPSAAWSPSGATSPPEVADAIAAGPQADVIIASSYTPEALEKLTSRRKATRLLSGPAPEQAGAPAAQPRHAACSCRTSTPSSRPAAQWRTVTTPQPHRGRVARPGAGLAGVRPHDLQRHRRRHRRPGGRRRRRAAVPRRRRRDRRAEGGRAGQGRRRGERRLLPLPRRAARPGRRRRDRGGPAGWLGPATRRSIAAADEAGLAMVMTGERHFRH